MKKLAPCPDTPNCVSTQSANPSKRMPALGFEGDAEPVRRALLELLAKTPRVRVVEATADYVHAEFTTPLFRYVDDIEFLIDPEGKRVHFRSASREGHWDLGTNRRRMKKLCRRLCQQAEMSLLPERVR